MDQDSGVLIARYRMVGFLQSVYKFRFMAHLTALTHPQKGEGHLDSRSKA